MWGRGSKERGACCERPGKVQGTRAAEAGPAGGARLRHRCPGPFPRPAVPGGVRGYFGDPLPGLGARVASCPPRSPPEAAPLCQGLAVPG